MIRLLPIIFLITRLLTLAPLAYAASVQELAHISQHGTDHQDLPLDDDSDASEASPSCLEDESSYDVHIANYFSFQSYCISERIPFVDHSPAPPSHFIGSLFRPPIQIS